MAKNCKKIIIRATTFEQSIRKGVIFGIYMQFTFKWDEPMLCLNNGFIFWSYFDAASSTHHKKTCPTLGKGKFRFFGHLIPVLTQNEIKTHMLLMSRSPLQSWLGHWTTKIRESCLFSIIFWYRCSCYFDLHCSKEKCIHHRSSRSLICSSNKVLLKNSQILQESTRVEVSFL